MEFLEGHDLATVLAREGALPWERARRVAVQVARALAAAHSKGIIHRDLKPENIFLVEREGRKDFVKVVDFGIAKLIGLDDSARKLTKTGMIFGTPDYMSPEQATGRPLDQRADIYALGVILYEMLTGKVPFDAPSFMAILTKHMFEDPVPPSLAAPDLDIDAAVDALVLKALEKDPDNRFQSMTEFAEAMKTLNLEASQHQGARLQSLEGPILLTHPKPGGLSPESTAPVTSFPPLPVRKSRAGLAAAVILLLFAGVAGAYLALRLTREKDSSRQKTVAGPEPHLSQGSDRDAGMTAPLRFDAAVSVARQAARLPAKIHLSVSTKPPGAKVFLGNRFVGLTPLQNVEISASSDKAVLSVRKKHYEEATVDFVPERDQAFRIVLERHRRGQHRPSRVTVVRPARTVSKTPRPRPRSRRRPRSRSGHGADGDLMNPFGH